MSRFLLASTLACGFSLVHLLVFRLVADSLLSGAGSFTVFLVSTTVLRLGAALAMLLTLLIGGVGAALAGIAGLWCVRTGLLAFALLERKS